MLFNTKILQNGLNAQFDEQYRRFLQNPEIMRAMEMMTMIDSQKASESYAWLGDVPGVQEWIGTKDLGGLSDYDYTIKNKDWYAGFSIDRNEIEDQQIPAIGPRIAAVASKVARWPYELVLQLVINGTTNLAYDGAAFFSNRSTNDNLLSGSGVTLANLKTDITTARTTLMRMVTDQGEFMGIRGNLILCPPELEVTMLEAINAPSIATNGVGTSINPLSGFGLSVLAMPELTDANDWYMLDTTQPLKPFIFQRRKAPVPVLDDTEVADSRKLKYSAEMRGNAGYGFYQMAVKVTNT